MIADIQFTGIIYENRSQTGDLKGKWSIFIPNHPNHLFIFYITSMLKTTTTKKDYLTKKELKGLYD